MIKTILFQESQITEIVKEIEREGIAVDLDSAIRVFEKEIDPTATKSGRLFDQDLNGKDLVFLDIGCGIGRHLLILKNNDIQHFFGFDIVHKLVQIARDEFGLRNLFVANAIRIPIADDSVDRCLFYNTIEHCSEPEEVLRQIWRVLRNGGILYMDVPNYKSMGDRIFRWGGKIIYGKTSHIQKFTKEKIENLIKKAGFKIDECTTHRGIFVDYPQLKEFAFLKWILRFLFEKEVCSWELKLIKES